MSNEAGKKRLRSNFGYCARSERVIIKGVTRMHKTYTVKPRFWLILMATFLAVFTPLYVILDARSDDMQRAQEALIARRDALSAQMYSLSEQLDYVRSDRGIEQLARANGMIMPGETQYIAVEGD